MKRKTILWLIGAPLLGATPFLAFVLYLMILMPAQKPTEKVDLIIENPKASFASGLVAEITELENYSCFDEESIFICYWSSTKIVIPDDGTGIYFRYPQQKRSWLAPPRKLPDPTHPITEIQEILEEDAIVYERRDRTS